MPKGGNIGRPEKKIDWNVVETLLEAGSLGTEVAAYIGIHPDTLYRQCQETHGMTFTDYTVKYRAKGDLRLKAKQFDVAMRGDKTMLVWLGKQRLGQREKFDHDHTTLGKEMNTIVNVNTLSNEELDDTLQKYLSKGDTGK